MNIQQLKTPHGLLNSLVAILLLAALGKHPYGYYKFVHLAAFIAGGYMSWLAYQASRNVLVVAFLSVAVLFNPIFPIHLTRAIWQPIDVACAIAFVVSALFFRPAQKPNR